MSAESKKTTDATSAAHVAPPVLATTDSPAPDLKTGDGARQTRDLVPESDLWTGRTHWKHFSGLILRALALNLIVAVAMWQSVSRGIIAQASAGWWVVLGIAAASLTYLALRMGLTILNERYRLTSQRLFIERGILSQTVDQLELVRVDDVRISKTLLGRIFGTGTVSVLTTDATDRSILLTGVLNPEEVAEAVRTHVRASRQRSLYVENI